VDSVLPFVVRAMRNRVELLAKTLAMEERSFSWWISSGRAARPNSIRRQISSKSSWKYGLFNPGGSNSTSLKLERAFSMPSNSVAVSIVPWLSFRSVEILQKASRVSTMLLGSTEELHRSRSKSSANCSSFSMNENAWYVCAIGALNIDQRASIYQPLVASTASNCRSTSS